MSDTALMDILDKMPPEKLRTVAEAMYAKRAAAEKDPMAFAEELPAQHEFGLLFPMYDILGLFGGNRSGKTFLEAYLLGCYLRGCDPAGWLPKGFQFPAPRRRFANRVTTTLVWWGAENRAKGIEAVEMTLLPMLPPDTYHWSRVDGMLTMNNGAQLKVMSYDMEPGKWASSAVDFIALDEECPWPIYQECLARISTRSGKLMIGVTPLHGGIEWAYWEFVENFRDKKSITYLNADMDDNFYLTEKQKRMLHEAYDDEPEAAARLHGVFLVAEGVVHKKFNRKRHVVEPYKIVASEWLRRGYRFGRVFDLHTRNDLICQWFMYKRAYTNSRVIFFDEISYPSGDAKEFAEVVNVRTDELKVPVFLNIIDTHESADGARVDPTMVSMMSDKGIRGRSAITRSVPAGISRFNDYLVGEDEEGNPSFQVFSTCVNTIHSIKRLQFKNHKGAAKEVNDPSEKINKKDADEVRNIHYVVLELPPVNVKKMIAKAAGNAQRLGADYSRNRKAV
jgi:phage terminase large subunit-like protein